MSYDAFSYGPNNCNTEFNVNHSFPALSCSKGAWLTAVWLSILLYVILLPGVMLAWLLLLFKRGLLNDETTMHRWGFLYQAYQGPLYWMEPLLLIRRLLVVSISVSTQDEPNDRSRALVAVFVSFLLMQVWVHPYFASSSNFWEGLALGCLVIVSSLVSGHSLLDDGPYSTAVQVLSSTIVSVFGLVLLGRVLVNKYSTSKRVKSIRTWLAHRCDCWPWMQRRLRETPSTPSKDGDSAVGDQSAAQGNERSDIDAADEADSQPRPGGAKVVIRNADAEAFDQKFPVPASDGKNAARRAATFQVLRSNGADAADRESWVAMAEPFLRRSETEQ